MWRLLLILSLVLHPLTLVRMPCAGSHSRTAAVLAGGCCSGGQCAPSSTTVRESGCCSGAAVCNCGDTQRDEPALPPARSGSLDQILVALQCPAAFLRPADDIGFSACMPARPVVLLPAMEAPQPFFCVWLT
ncbi:MAG: hypothetical protein KF817_05335 [Phycisphaeraceae bacterium]|nr:hypothetical protein [Phycisphaeraceae bacterium]